MHSKKQVLILTAMKAVRAFMIAIPIIVIYWQSHGLAIRDIFILQVIFSVAIVLFEIPTGYFADRYGLKRSLLLGSIMGTVGFFLYYSIPSYIGFVAAELALALGGSFVSGAHSALLYETLKQVDEEENYKKIQGRLLAVGTGSEAIAALLAGVIVSISNIETVLFIQWVVVGLTVPLSLLLIDIPANMEEQRTLGTILSWSLRENKRLRYLHVYAGGISAATLTMVWFSQPYWENLGVRIEYFGYFWAGLNMMVVMGSLLAHWVDKKVRFRLLFACFAIAPPLLYLLMYATTSIVPVLVVAALFWFLRGIHTPIVSDYVQRECRSGERATVLSVNALVSRLIFSIFSPLLGWVADVWSLKAAFLASGITFGIITITGFVLLYSTMGSKKRLV